MGLLPPQRQNLAPLLQNVITLVTVKAIKLTKTVWFPLTAVFVIVIVNENNTVSTTESVRKRKDHVLRKLKLV